MSTNLSKTFLTPAETAWLLGVPKSWVNRAIRRGTLRTIRRRSRLVIPASEVVRLLNQAPGGDT